MMRWRELLARCVDATKSYVVYNVCPGTMHVLQLPIPLMPLLIVAR